MKGFEPSREGVAKASSSLRRVLSQHGNRFVRFGLVGACGVLVNYALLYLLVGVGGVNHLAAALPATEAAILSNFMFNNLWTFGDAHPTTAWVRRASQYNLFCLGGLVISVVTLAMLTYFLHIHYLVANIFAIGVATLWNYTANRYWTWPATSLTQDTKAVIKGEV
jgi:dolichol-phosphate mannosyltransferase